MARPVATLAFLIFAFLAAWPVAAQEPTKAPATPSPLAAETPSERLNAVAKDMQRLDETMRLRLEALEKSGDERARAHDGQTRAQDERISDLHAGYSNLSIIIAVLGGLFALGSVGISYLSADKVARREVEKWIKDSGDKKLNEMIGGKEADYETRIRASEKKAQEQINASVAAAEGRITALLDSAEQSKAAIDNIIAQAQESLAKDQKPDLSLEQKSIIAVAAEEAKAKPKADWTYRDWALQAIAAEAKGDNTAEAEAWGRAAVASDATPLQTAMALFNKGVTLGQSGRWDEAIAAYDAVIARFGDAAEPALREQTAKALVNKGVALGQSGRPDEEIAAYDAVIARFGDAAEPALRELVAKALVNKGVALGQSGRPDEAIAVYDAVISRFGDAAEPALRESVAKALVNKGVAFGQSGRPNEEIAAYDAVIARFGDAAEPALREQTAKALVNKGGALRQPGRPDEAIAAFDAVIARFGDAAEPALRELVAMALVNKGVALGQSGRPNEEIAAYDAVLARFGDAAEPALREQTAKAFNGKAFTYLMLAKQARQDPARMGEAPALLEKSLADARAARAKGPAEDVLSIILGNQAYALFLLGRREEAEGSLRQALQLGGKKVYDAELEDARLHRLEPDDSDFEALVKRLWAEVSGGK